MNAATNVVNSLNSRQQKTSALKHVWLEITEKCNLSCVHCYSESSPHLPLSRGMEVDDWLNVLHTSREMGCKSVQFIGGEPTIHPYLDFLLQEASSLGFESIEVFTNGVAISSERIARYKEWNINVALSFYSTNPDVHDSITERQGSYYRTLGFIKKAVQAGLELRVGIIQIDQTDAEIEETKHFLRSLGVKNINFDRVRKVGRAQQQSTSPLETTLQNRLHELCGACHNGRACVTSSGDVFPCIMARADLLGNVRSQSLQDIIYGEPRKAFVTAQLAYLNQINVQSASVDDPCAPHCVPQYGNCNPTQTTSSGSVEPLSVSVDDPCAPHCVPQFGNCNPTQSSYIDTAQFVAGNSCNPQNGGTCVPQMGNCNPNENK
ncbi:radical SAM protein [Spirosoma lituiforme]